MIHKNYFHLVGFSFIIYKKKKVLQTDQSLDKHFIRLLQGWRITGSQKLHFVCDKNTDKNTQKS